MAIVHRNFMAIFTNEAVFPLGFDGIRPFSVAGRRVFVYDRGERRITLQEDTPMKIMAIDYGDAHTGIAISDPTGTLAGFSTVINSRKADIVVEEIVRLIAGTPIRARPSQEIKDLRTEIHHIGNNINQIARSVNAGIATAEDARRGLFLLDKVYELMYQVANP